MDVIDLVLLVGASQGLLLSAVIVFLRSANTRANRFLSIFVGLESLHLLWLALTYFVGLRGLSPAVIGLLFLLRVLAGPALYLYVCAMSVPQFRLNARHALHLLIFLPGLIWWISFLGHYDDWLQQSFAQHQIQPSTIWLAFYTSVFFVCYGIAALRLLSRHTRRLEQALSSTEAISLWWLRAVISLIIINHLLGLGLDILRLQQYIAAEPRVWINLATTLLVIYLISFGGMRQPAIFTQSVSDALAALGTGEEPEDTAIADEDTGKYRKSGMDKARIQLLWEKLQEALDKQELYREVSLDLPTLARSLLVRPQELSQVINTVSGGSFYDLINDYRVEAAKRLLADSDSSHRKLFDIALEAGFSSQSTFYSQFKKRTGKTPSAFRANGHNQPT